jgi:hypothetical protein
VRDSHFIGNVDGAASVGGVVGRNVGVVDGCYSIAVVTGNDAVGGLVGSNSVAASDASFGYITSTISNSYATGSVSGAMGVGGIAGHNGGMIINSYAANEVIGESSVGGIAGLTWNNWNVTVLENNVALNPGIAFAAFNGGRISGRIASPRDRYTQANNFARNDLAVISQRTQNPRELDIAPGGRDGENVTEAQYGSQSFWSDTLGWDFTEVWDWNSEAGLPVLRNAGGEQNPAVLAAGEFTIDGFAMYIVAVEANAGGLAHISPDGETIGVFGFGNTVTAAAVPDYGFMFIEWRDGDGNAVSTDAEYSFTVAADVKLTAVFRHVIEIMSEEETAEIIFYAPGKDDEYMPSDDENDDEAPDPYDDGDGSSGDGSTEDDDAIEENLAPSGIDPALAELLDQLNSGTQW